MQDSRIKSDIPILLLTAMDEIEDRIAGLESGADDYLAKPFEPRELVLRLNAVLRRAQAKEVENGSAIRFGNFSFNGSRGELYRDETLIKLTWGEIGLLRAFARHVGVSVSRDVLAGRMGVSPRTVDVQIARLRRKIESDLSHPHYLITVRGEGYVLRAN
jgi:two-component system phosphate regulon response regulator OmpR